MKICRYKFVLFKAYEKQKKKMYNSAPQTLTVEKAFALQHISLFCKLYMLYGEHS